MIYIIIGIFLLILGFFILAFHQVINNVEINNHNIVLVFLIEFCFIIGTTILILGVLK